VAGTGQTVNLSSSGALIASEHRIELGAKIALFMDWPIMLNGTTPLQFVGRGRVVRSDADAFALSLEHHEFRIRKKRPQSVSDTESHGEVSRQAMRSFR
jgi:hypothetical protein